MDNADRPSDRAERAPQARADDRDDSSKKTPGTDMQADDAAGAAAGGQDAAKRSREDMPAQDTRATAGGTAAQEAMKQTDKTDAEAGG